MKRATYIAIPLTALFVFVVYVLSQPAIGAQLKAAFGVSSGDQITCLNNGRIDFDFRQQHRMAVVQCAQVPPTATPVPTLTFTPVSSTLTNTPAPLPTVTNTPLPQVNTMQLWHPPGAHDGLNPHEHGDAPPQWANDWSQATFGHPVIYGGDEASSPMENTMKHPAFKGFGFTTGNGVELYIRYHAASNFMDRAAALHSYEVYAKDSQGGISFWQGLYFAGWPDVPSHRITRAQEVPGCCGLGANWPGRGQFSIATPNRADPNFEQWYTYGGNNWGWSLGITIGGSTTYRPDAPGPEPEVNDLTGALGLDRRIEASLYGPDNPFIRENTTPRGQWYCVRKMPDMPATHTHDNTPVWVVGGAVANQDSCPPDWLPEFTANTFPRGGVWFEVGNVARKDFPGAGVVTFPN